jgi:hypothetical protein
VAPCVEYWHQLYRRHQHLLMSLPSNVNLSSTAWGLPDDITSSTRDGGARRRWLSPRSPADPKTPALPGGSLPPGGGSPRDSGEGDLRGKGGERSSHRSPPCTGAVRVGAPLPSPRGPSCVCCRDGLLPARSGAWTGRVARRRRHPAGSSRGPAHRVARAIRHSLLLGVHLLLLRMLISAIQAASAATDVAADQR